MLWFDGNFEYDLSFWFFWQDLYLAMFKIVHLSSFMIIFEKDCLFFEDRILDWIYAHGKNKRNLIRFEWNASFYVVVFNHQHLADEIILMREILTSKVTPSGFGHSLHWSHKHKTMSLLVSWRQPWSWQLSSFSLL